MTFVPAIIPKGCFESKSVAEKRDLKTRPAAPQRYRLPNNIFFKKKRPPPHAQTLNEMFLCKEEAGKQEKVTFKFLYPKGAHRLKKVGDLLA